MSRADSTRGDATDDTISRARGGETILKRPLASSARRGFARHEHEQRVSETPNRCDVRSERVREARWSALRTRANTRLVRTAPFCLNRRWARMPAGRCPGSDPRANVRYFFTLRSATSVPTRARLLVLPRALAEPPLSELLPAHRSSAVRVHLPKHRLALLRVVHPELAEHLPKLGSVQFAARVRIRASEELPTASAVDMGASSDDVVVSRGAVASAIATRSRGVLSGYMTARTSAKDIGRRREGDLAKTAGREMRRGWRCASVDN